jgi:FixJ family two-component response regulator
MLIALVDDDQSVRAAVDSLLRAHGHDVLTFVSAEEFLAAQLRPACLVLDNRLPGMSGLDLHRHLEHSNQLVPIVFVTSSDASAAEVNALVARGVAIAQFGKPFDPLRFVEAIDKAVSPVKGN